MVGVVGGSACIHLPPARRPASVRVPGSSNACFLFFSSSLFQLKFSGNNYIQIYAGFFLPFTFISNSTMGWEKSGEGWRKKEKVTFWARIKNKVFFREEMGEEGG